MSGKQDPTKQFPLKLSLAQRKVIAQILPIFAQRLQLDALNVRMVPLTLDEIRMIHQAARPYCKQIDSGLRRYSLRRVVAVTEKALEDFTGIGRISVKDRIYQFRVALKGITPPIWRRFQTRDCTIDKLHDRIQNAMGWTNSHLHHFRINKKLYGDPWLMDDGFESEGYIDSTVATISEVVPRSGERFHFEYEYDFGDGWWHDVLFEGCLKSTPGQRYPICLEGERTCPPEDVGGSSGYRKFVRSIARPSHPDHDENLVWIGGSFDPEHFDPEKATRRMIRGLPNWRQTAY